MIILSGGYVGIGTNVPEIALDVSVPAGELLLPASSGTTAAGIIRIGYETHSWAGVELNFGVYNGGGYPAWIQAQNPNDHSVQRVLALNPLGGNVGIGDTTPTYKLDVNGTGRFVDDLLC
ncbi:hypothetical protein LCGC14_2930840, partial [marine sediment metagenome]